MPAKTGSVTTAPRKRAAARPRRASAAAPKRTEVPAVSPDVHFEHGRDGSMWMVVQRRSGRPKRVWLSAASYASIPKAIREPNKPVALSAMEDPR